MPGGNLFVVQLHHARARHFDFRLEIDGVLRSWAVPKGPSPDPTTRRFAVQTEDHPLEYANFEGRIPTGNYGAGTVIVWDQGQWQPIGDIEQGFAAGKLLFDLHGRKLQGRWTLIKTRRGERDWLLIKERDAHVRDVDTEKAYPHDSVLSGLTVEQVAAQHDPAPDRHRKLAQLRAPRRRVDAGTLTPMLAGVARPFSAEGWLFELKYDGYRVLACLEEGRAVLRSRAGNDLSASFPEVTFALSRLPFGHLVLDGEIVVHDARGLPDFGLLQQRARLTRRHDIAAAAVRLPAACYAFDLLALDDYDLRPLPLHERKQQLLEVLPRAGLIRYADHIERNGEAMFTRVAAMGLEGVIAKRADSPWVGRRSDDWLKITVEHEADCVILGYTDPRGAQSGFGALLLGQLAAEDGPMHYVGRVGTGFAGRVRDSLWSALRAAPAGTAPAGGRTEVGWHWCRTELVAKVRYKQYSREGRLRQPVFVALRNDKAAAECVVPARVSAWIGATPDAPAAPAGGADTATDTPAAAGKTGHGTPTGSEVPTADEVTISNRDKVFWPEQALTKGDLVDYYRAVSPWLLPWLDDRPLVLTRYPDGIEGKSFFQKDAPAYAPDWLRRETLWSQHAEREVHYFVASDEASLAWIINLGTIPLHVWSSRIGALERPDWSILDLDPKGAPFADVITIAKHLHRICHDVSLPAFVKTSGSTGLHVLLPLGGQLDYEQSRSLAELLARITVAALPRIATVTRAVERRQNKVYIDYLQNGHGRLLVAPYSVRPLPGAPVSMPLAWREIRPGLDPQRYTIANALRRLRALKTDPWAGLLDCRPDLAGALERLGSMLAQGPPATPAADR
jgi:bifunctional non-homologous end joining protein LigD